jgi:hypothetical protein
LARTGIAAAELLMRYQLGAARDATALPYWSDSHQQFMVGHHGRASSYAWSTGPVAATPLHAMLHDAVLLHYSS